MSGVMLRRKPRAIAAFYGYGDLTGPWYNQPDPFYLKQRHVSRGEAAGTIGADERAEAHGNRREILYVYMRQQGLWTPFVTGLDPKRDEATLDRFCPVRALTGEYPPTILLHGDADTDVPFEQAVDMDKALARAHVEHEFIRLHGKDHGFDFDSANPEVVAAFERAVDFLEAQLHRRPCAQPRSKSLPARKHRN